nr:hypothetical protein [Burkholderia ambifaria]
MTLTVIPAFAARNGGNAGSNRRASIESTDRLTWSITAPPPLYRLLEHAERVADLLAVLEHLATGHGQLDTVRPTLEQAKIEHVLKLLDTAAQRRDADAERLGRTPHHTALREYDEMSVCVPIPMQMVAPPRVRQRGRTHGH